MKLSARLYHCVRCHRQVIICSHCDRGNIYCKTCAPLARVESLRAADQRYQHTHRGKLKHAERQRRYRERQSENPIKVTDQGSKETDNSFSLNTQKNASGDQFSERNTDPLRCDFCKNLSCPLLRQGFLPTRGGQTLWITWPLGP